MANRAMPVRRVRCGRRGKPRACPAHGDAKKSDARPDYCLRVSDNIATNHMQPTMTTPSNNANIVTHTARSYDETPYTSMPFFLSHPNHLALLATLFGMQPPAPETARILEIGCASGGNLLPIAAQYPQARCLGIDLSGKQIQLGQADIDGMELANIELAAMDVMDFDGGKDQFDYILCHGVFSWVPPNIRAKILTICRDHLAGNGLAYISYNTYPGWHFKEVSRYLMYRVCEQFQDPDERYKNAMGILDRFADLAKNSSDFPMAQLLRESQKHLSGLGRDYVLHEYLEAVNTPFYFRDFVYACGKYDLGYVCDAELAPMLLDKQPRPVRELIGTISSNRLQTEEYLDFLTARTFRCSIITAAKNELNMNIQPQLLMPLHVSGKLSTGELEKGKFWFAREGMGDEKSTSDSPLLKAALDQLKQIHPCSERVESLFLQACRGSGTPVEALDDQKLQETLDTFTHDLLSLGINDYLQISLHAPACTGVISDHPRLTPVALMQARSGRANLTNARHQAVPCARGVVRLLAHFDGEQSEAALKRRLAKEVAQGHIEVADGVKRKTAAQDSSLINAGYQRIVEHLRDNALLAS